MINIKPDSEVEKAIENLYNVFSAYPLKKQEACPCCHSEEDLRKVTTRPLRELNNQDLFTFYSDVLTTWGDVEDLKHFLPRLLDLQWSSEDEDETDFFMICLKLKDADWFDWPMEERTAISEFFRASWRQILCSESFQGESWQPEIRVFLDCLETCTDINPFLEYWANQQNLGSIEQVRLTFPLVFGNFDGPGETPT